MNAELVLKNSLSEIERIPEFLEELTEEFLFTEELGFQINLALEELVVNIISYGYQEQRESEIHISFHQEDGRLRIVLQDDARAFNPLEVPEPDLEVSLEDRKIGGLGVFLVRKLFDHLSYERQGEHNVLTLEKTLPTPATNHSEQK